MPLKIQTVNDYLYAIATLTEEFTQTDILTSR